MRQNQSVVVYTEIHDITHVAEVCWLTPKCWIELGASKSIDIITESFFMSSSDTSLFVLFAK